MKKVIVFTLMFLGCLFCAIPEGYVAAGMTTKSVGYCCFALLLLLVGLAIIFYISKHRGFTHTILGITILSYVFLLMIMGFIPVFMRLSLNIGISIPTVVYIFIIMAIIGYFIISRRYYVLYLVVLLL